MSFAPHTNDHVRTQAALGQKPTALPLLLGQFRHKDTGVVFEYSERRGFGDVWPGIVQQIYCSDGTTRLAIVKKTVAKVVVDEDASGLPVWESWPIKQHHQYLTDWVRR
jgi:hypothetical protein